MEYHAIIAGFEELKEQFVASYRAADETEKKTVLENRPQPDPFIDQMIDLAKTNQGKPVATKPWSGRRFKEWGETQSRKWHWPS